MANFYLDICLSDIPKERIKTASNGKKYLKAIINPRKSPDSDGYDHYIAAFVPKEERNDGEGPAFIGRAQEKNFDRDRAQQPAPYSNSLYHRQIRRPLARPTDPANIRILNIKDTDTPHL